MYRPYLRTRESVGKKEFLVPDLLLIPDSLLDTSRVISVSKLFVIFQKTGSNVWSVLAKKIVCVLVKE